MPDRPGRKSLCLFGVVIAPPTSHSKCGIAQMALYMHMKEAMSWNDEQLHIRTIRLFDVGRDGDSDLTEEEKKHLRDCEECKAVVAVFTRQFSRQKPHDKESAA